MPTNPTVSMTATDRGAEFGPYADGGAAGGSVFYSGLNGMRLGDIVNLVYTGSFSSDTDTGRVGVPYLRVFLEGDTHVVTFSPNTQPFPLIAEDVLHRLDVTEGTVRYDDDPGAWPRLAMGSDRGSSTPTRSSRASTSRWASPQART